MNELAVQINNVKGQLVVSSRVVAEQLGKEHYNVIRDLEKILENSNVSSLIISSTYEVSGQKRKYKEYLLTKDGFTLYMFNIQGYNDFKMAYINRFNEMEKALHSISERDRLYLGLFDKDPMVVANSHKALVELEKKPLLEKIEQDKPLVEFANQVSSSSDAILVREFCKILADEKIKIGQNTLYQWFRGNGYIIKGGTEPTQKAINMGLFEVQERTIKTPYGDKLTFTTKITGKGQIYFTEKLRKLY